MIKPGGYALEDLILRKRIQEIVSVYNIECIVETGLNEGKSTAVFASMVPTVVGIDNDEICINSTEAQLYEAGLSGKVTLLHGNSPDVLTNIRPLLPDKTLYFLDAHWESYWPVLDEIKALKKGKGIVVLHDIEVPDHPELGFDEYKGQLLKSGYTEDPIKRSKNTFWVEIYQPQQFTYEYVKNVLIEWSPSHRIEYNERTEGTNSPRGVAFIFPT